MVVTAWNNGRHNESGSGYGIKISVADRDQHFQKNWKTILLRIDDQKKEIKINTNKKSFWGNTCRELIHKQIGLWFRQTKMAPWPKGTPPSLKLIHVSNNHFMLKTIVQQGTAQGGCRKG
ncbi:MAG: hypothetical protein NT096_10975 [Proteobacteria bacterium]|nr:hypothetical protein [Pseudomonadota bacterium]